MPAKLKAANDMRDYLVGIDTTSAGRETVIDNPPLSALHVHVLEPRHVAVSLVSSGITAFEIVFWVDERHNAWVPYQLTDLMMGVHRKNAIKMLNGKPTAFFPDQQHALAERANDWVKTLVTLDYQVEAVG